ncbi:Polyadenylate-binding protein-interacting protein 1-like protein [Leptotrombidium deliense]|uniref:Polyadenylate-binding protein-interacting protein 1-like protein n=1 Tax=Leptotrombidium deliense TaxID=299467 RepID=A0A443SUX1_9ACAR|nr:Polyadenylate-binding protein-interacting protein 1-like protein [Leptotrombidium deliense]
MESHEHGLGRGTVRNVASHCELRRPLNPSNMQALISDTQRMNLISSDNRQQLSGYKVGGNVGNHSWSNNSENASNCEQKLNPLASEFIPNFMKALPTATTTTTTELYYPPAAVVNGETWSSDALDFNGDSSEGSKRSEPDDFVALNELKEFIDLISSQPAQYETQLPFLTDVLNNWIEEDEEIIMLCVVNTIVDQAIVDQNFRYNGVRLCIHLIENLRIETANGAFKDLLLQRCRREHNRREQLSVASDGGAYLRGVTLLIGELALRLVDMRLFEEIPDLITTLLIHPTIENLKCCCMVLKLCGPTLDQHLKGTSKVDSIMQRLQTIVNDDGRVSTCKDLVTNVIELRNNEWKTAPVTSMAVNPYAAGDGVDIAFGDYLGNEGDHTSPTPAYYFGPCGDEQDTDVCEAFDEFLRASGQLQ